MILFSLLAAVFLFAPVAGSIAAEPVASATVVEGRLNRESLEGGFWTLLADNGTLYDLHGEVIFQDGDRIQAAGIAPKGLRCSHMRGIIFIPTSIEKIASAALPVAPSLESPKPASLRLGDWTIAGRKLIFQSSTGTPALTMTGDPKLMGVSETRDSAWKLAKDTFSVYGSGGDILWQADKVQKFLVSPDGRTAILLKRIDPKGGKKRRDYAVVYRDGKPVFEFFAAPIALTPQPEDFPAYLSKNGRFGWVKDRSSAIFFDVQSGAQKAEKGDEFPEIDEAGAYKVWGIKFGGSYTLLLHEGKLE